MGEGLRPIKGRCGYRPFEGAGSQMLELATDPKPGFIGPGNKVAGPQDTTQLIEPKQLRVLRRHAPHRVRVQHSSRSPQTVWAREPSDPVGEVPDPANNAPPFADLKVQHQPGERRITAQVCCWRNRLEGIGR